MSYVDRWGPVTGRLLDFVEREGFVGAVGPLPPREFYDKLEEYTDGAADVNQWDPVEVGSQKYIDYFEALGYEV